MRILAVGNMYPPHHFGGYELVWRSAVRHLRAHGHEVRVLTTDTVVETSEPEDEGTHRELRWTLRDGVLEQLPFRAARALAYHNHGVLDRHLRELRPHVVTWWSMGGLTLTMLEDVRRRSIPAVAFVHDDWLDYGRWHDRWHRTFYGPRRARLAPLAERLESIPCQVMFGDAASYAFVSENVRAHALGLGLGLRRTSVAHSGIHEDFLAPAQEQAWDWNLLYVGRLDPRKGVDTAIESLVVLEKAHLSIVGGWDLSEESRLRSLVSKLGLTGRVAFLGQKNRPGLLDAYEAADAVVFPVKWEEPWGLVPLEAMGRGRPVLATGRGGSGEYLRNGENCVLFRVGDAGALATAVLRLAGDVALRARLRATGFVTAARYTESRFNDAVLRAVAEEAEASTVGEISAVAAQ